MSSPSTGRPRALLIGGSGGFVGRAVYPLLLRDFALRSLHRHPLGREGLDLVEWVRADAGDPDLDWAKVLDGVDVVVNLAWHRAGRPEMFAALGDGLCRMAVAAQRAGIRRLVHLSVPPAPAPLERSFPYLVERRRVDDALARSGLSYRILRPTMLYGPGDVLLGVMRREIRRYGFFPMCGDGRYHVSPRAVADLATILRAEVEGGQVGTRDLGGPRRMEYRELTDQLFRAEGRRPRYWRMSERSGRRLAGLLERLGSHLLYAYEVEWLVSDLLGLPPATPGGEGLTTVESYLGLAGPNAGAT